MCLRVCPVPQNLACSRRTSVPRDTSRIELHMPMVRFEHGISDTWYLGYKGFTCDVMCVCARAPMWLFVDVCVWVDACVPVFSLVSRVRIK